MKESVGDLDDCMVGGRFCLIFGRGANFEVDTEGELSGSKISLALKRSTSIISGENIF